MNILCVYLEEIGDGSRLLGCTGDREGDPTVTFGEVVPILRAPTSGTLPELATGL